MPPAQALGILRVSSMGPHILLRLNFYPGRILPLVCRARVSDVESRPLDGRTAEIGGLSGTRQFLIGSDAYGRLPGRGIGLFGSLHPGIS